MLKNLPSGSIEFDDGQLFVLDGSGNRDKLDDFISWKFDFEIDNLMDELKDIFHFCDVRFSDYGEIIPNFIKRLKDKKNASVKANIMSLISKMANAKSLSELNFAYNELISIVKDVHRFLVTDRDEVNDYLDSYIRNVHDNRNVILSPGGIAEDYLLPSGQSVREFRESFAENPSGQKKIIIEYIQTFHSFLQEKILFMERADRVKKSGISEKMVEVRTSDLDNSRMEFGSLGEDSSEPSDQFDEDAAFDTDLDNSRMEFGSLGDDSSEPSDQFDEDAAFDTDFSESDNSEMYFYDLTRVPLKEFDSFPEREREIAYGIIAAEEKLYPKEAELDILLDKIDICERWEKFLLKLPADTIIRHIDVANYADVPLIESIMDGEKSIICSSDFEDASTVYEEIEFVSSRIEPLKRTANELKTEIDFLKGTISVNCKMLSSIIGTDEMDSIIGLNYGIHR